MAKPNFLIVGAEKFIQESLARLKTSTNAEKSLETADLVIESVTENLELKQKLFATYDQMAPAKTIFASNTSSLSIGAIAEATPNRVDRFGGLHFFNPVAVMKLLEVIRTPNTSDETFNVRLFKEL